MPYAEGLREFRKTFISVVLRELGENQYRQHWSWGYTGAPCVEISKSWISIFENCAPRIGDASSRLELARQSSPLDCFRKLRDQVIASPISIRKPAFLLSARSRPSGKDSTSPRQKHQEVDAADDRGHKVGREGSSCRNLRAPLRTGEDAKPTPSFGSAWARVTNGWN